MIKALVKGSSQTAGSKTESIGDDDNSPDTARKPGPVEITRWQRTISP
jgi:hypothetical protein